MNTEKLSNSRNKKHGYSNRAHREIKQIMKKEQAHRTKVSHRISNSLMKTYGIKSQIKSKEMKSKTNSKERKSSQEKKRSKFKIKNDQDAI